MLSYDWKRDRYVHGPTKSLEERLYDEAGLALSEIDRQHDDLKPEQTEPDYDRIDRLDAYITGIEKLLAWEG